MYYCFVSAVPNWYILLLQLPAISRKADGIIQTKLKIDKRHANFFMPYDDHLYDFDSKVQKLYQIQGSIKRITGKGLTNILPLLQ